MVSFGFLHIILKVWLQGLRSKFFEDIVKEILYGHFTEFVFLIHFFQIPQFS